MGKRVYILTRNYYNFETSEVRIGGVETYISELVKIFHSLNYNVYLYAFDEKERSIVTDFGEIRGYNIQESKNETTLLAKKVQSDMVDANDLVVINTDGNVSLKIKFNRMIAIQHGVAWDIPVSQKSSLLRLMVAKTRTAYNTIKRAQAWTHIVCVDYNYPCWYRAVSSIALENYTVIPNFSHIPEEPVKPDGVINIIFARRLVEYRGTKVFTMAISKILKERNNIHVTIAGTGPDEQWMRERLEKYHNVEFTHYEASQSMMIHADKHIAVVPTVGSEGTSLSLIEAMASRCTVVCTDVGGMTNIVINNYNGKRVRAGSVDDLYEAISELLDNPDLLKRLSRIGFQTVESSFSYEQWRGKWVKVIESV